VPVVDYSAIVRYYEKLAKVEVRRFALL